VYRWENYLDPAEAPDWLLDLACPREKANEQPHAPSPHTGEGTPYGKKALAEELTTLSRATEGARNDTLNKCTFSLAQLVAGGELPEEEVRQALFNMALAIGLDTDESAHTIHSAFTEGMKSPRAVERTKETKDTSFPEWSEIVPLGDLKAPEIPEDIIPGWAGDFAREAARAIQVPYPMVAAATLGAVSLAVCAAVQEIQVKPGYGEPLNIYAMAPLPSGERKTGVVDETNAPLYAFEAEQAEIMGPGIRAAHSRRKTAEKIIEARRNKAAKAKDEDRKALIESIAQDEAALEEVPALPRLLADDVTPERLAGLLRDQGELIGIITSEGGFFDIIGGRYSRDGNANLDLFLKGHSREPYRVDRVGRDPIVLSHPRIVACICPQPEVVQRFSNTPGFRGRGVVARFLYFYSDSKVGYRSVSVDPIPERVKSEYALYIKSLLSMRGKNLVLTLSPGARAAWFSFAEGVEVEMRPGGEFEHFRDWAGKLPGQAVRLAGIFHCVTAQLPNQLEVLEETMSRALKLAAKLADHAKVAFDAMGCDPAMDTALTILEWIQRTRLTDFTLRECFRALNGRFHNTAEIRPGLNVLVERGYLIDKDTIPSGGKGRPRGPVYLVNPILGGDA
ncbi:MAG TPA: YfjI family protein, partial [Methanoregulaceae archaeon]|nr:YfjI family protein [Methanoregulaceae archaeon]